VGGREGVAHAVQLPDRAEPHFGELLAQGITSAFEKAAEGRRRRRQEHLQDQSRADQRTMTEVQNPGLHLTERGVFDIPQSVWDNTAKSASDAVDRGRYASPAAARGIPASSDRSDFQSLLSKAMGDQTPTGPRYEFGKGYYRDNAETDAAAQRTQARSGNAEFQRVLMHVLENGLTPKPQQHVVDPVTGKVNFFDPMNPPKDLSVTPAPKAPLMNSPEWRAGEVFKASLRPDDKTLVQVQQPDGTVVYMPRSQASGKHVPSKTGVAKDLPAPLAAKVGQAGEMIKKAYDLLPQMDALDVDVPESAAQDIAQHGLGIGHARIPGTQGVGSMLLNRTEPYSKYQASLSPFILAAAHALSGARINQDQVEQIRHSIEYKPGDSKNVKAQKRKNMVDLVNSISGSLPANAIAEQEDQMDAGSIALLKGYGYRAAKREQSTSPGVGAAVRDKGGDINLGAKPVVTQAQYDAGIAKGHSPAEIAQHYDVSKVKTK
jgi:hypothetical protein